MEKEKEEQFVVIISDYISHILAEKRESALENNSLNDISTLEGNGAES
jgi:hypothetical protein